MSGASVWEIAIMRSLGKLRVPDDHPANVTGGGIESLAVRAAHAWGDARERIGIVTRNPGFDAYGVDTLW